MRLSFFLVLMLISFQAFSQHSEQPQKESSEDLRSGYVIFSIQDLNQETLLWLERTSNSDFFLRFKNSEEEKILKISSLEAKKLDLEFASKFLKCQFELPPSEAGCKVTLRLNLKGEGQELCEKDDKKTQEIAPLANRLSKRF